jgi:hypothetical protein
LPSVTVTIVFPEVKIAIAWVVSLVDQRNELPALAVSVTESPAQKVVGPPAVMVASGSGLAVTFVGVETDEHPFPSVTVTTLFPEVKIAIAWVVSLVDQRNELPVLEVNTTESPAQKVVGPPAVMIAAGRGLTLIVVGCETAEHPLPSVIVTIVFPEVKTAITWVVSLVDQRNELPVLEVNTTESPAQKVVGPPAVMIAAGRGLTVIVVGCETAEHPFISVTVTL